jgi:hypothetical protein
MEFGLFCSAQANSGAFGPQTGRGFRDYLDFNVEAEALDFRRFARGHQERSTGCRRGGIGVP